MKRSKNPGFRMLIIWLLIAVVFIWFFLGHVANAQERIESAYINAPGQLVLVRKVGRFGVIEETFTVIYAQKEPMLCQSEDKRYLIYTEDALVIDRKPIEKNPHVCTDFAMGKCGHAIQTKDSLQ